MKFDVKGAKKAGYTDEEIANSLAENANFDAIGAREAGYDNANIIQTITTGKPFRDVTNVAATTEGMSRGAVDFLSTIAGAPVDIGTAIIEGVVNTATEIPARLKVLVIAYFPLLSRASAIPAAAPFAVAKGGGGLFKPIVNAAYNSPKLFATAEATSIAGSATGGGLAELIDPSDPVTRIFSEIAGGIMTPAAIMSKTVGPAFNSFKKLLNSYYQLKQNLHKKVKVFLQMLKQQGQIV
mgnify:CR=1 FL=1